MKLGAPQWLADKVVCIATKLILERSHALATESRLAYDACQNRQRKNDVRTGSTWVST